MKMCKRMAAAVMAVSLLAGTIGFPAAAVELQTMPEQSVLVQEGETSGTCGENVTWNFDAETGTLTISGEGAMDDFDMYYGYDKACLWSHLGDDITSVIIEDGVTGIGEGNFSFLFNATSIVIPDTVTSIGEWSFWSSAFSEITIPDGVTSIGAGAFCGCEMTYVVIPDSVTSIKDSAFYNCGNLTSVYYAGTEEMWNAIDIEGYNTSLLNASVYYETTDPVPGEENPSVTEPTYSEEELSGICGENATWKLDIATGTLTISGEGAMKDYPYYTTINTPWYSLRSLITSVVVEEGITKVGMCAFGGLSKVESVSLPESLKIIGMDALFETALTTVTIPDSVTEIGAYAFMGCTSLTSAEIPESLTNIGEAAFSGTAWEAAELENTGFFIVNHILLRGDWDRSDADMVIPDSVTRIGDNAFNGCSYASLTLSDSVTEIGSYAFVFAEIPEVVLPASVKYVDNNAFNQTGVYSITFLNPDCEIYDASETICTTFNEDWSGFYTGTLYGYDNSTAQAYAEKYGCTFVSLGEAPETTEADTTESTSTEDEPDYGDVDCNGTVNLLDVVLLNKHLMVGEKISDQGKLNADVDRNDTLNAIDSLNILKASIDLIKLPV